MQYLPYTEEKSRDEVMLSPTQQIGMERIPWLPTYSSAYNMMVGNDPATEDIPAVARYFYWVPAAFWWLLYDWLWQIWNTAVNWYKRLYNNWAAIYNNIAGTINGWNTPTVQAPTSLPAQNYENMVNAAERVAAQVTPQTSLTWRKIVSGINPANYNLTVAEVEKPTRYLANNWVPVAKIVEPNPTEIKIVPASNQQTAVQEAPWYQFASAEEQAAAKKQAMTQAKRSIANELNNIVSNWTVLNNLPKVAKLVSLYNKIK